MATIDRRGFVDDGTPNLTVVGSTTVVNVRNTPLTLAGSGVVTIDQPAFYFVPATGSSGEGTFTGSVPNPVSFPGSMLMLTETFGVFDWLLTGSAYKYGKALFVKMSGSAAGAVGGFVAGGGTVKLQPSASIQMVSDGFRWCIVGGTGSMQLAGNNL